jgi:hypothetical protein
MSWLLSGQLQSSLGSLKNQVASSLKEVFEAVDEDDDPDLEDPNQVLNVGFSQTYPGSNFYT